MEELIASLTNGRVSEVKVVLASVLAALAAYQVLLMAVGYGKLKLPFLKPAPASGAHRAIGDTVLAITLIVTAFCIGYFGFEADEIDAHPPIAIALLGVLAVKVAIVRWGRALGFLLPWLGVAVLLLFIATWVTVAAPHLV